MSFASRGKAIDGLHDGSDNGWLVRLAMRSLRQALDMSAAPDVKDC